MFVAYSEDGRFPTLSLARNISKVLYEYEISEVVIPRDISADEDVEQRRITLGSPAIKPVAVRHHRRHLEHENYQRDRSSLFICIRKIPESNSILETNILTDFFFFFR
jgi:hypothetical protein